MLQVLAGTGARAVDSEKVVRAPQNAVAVLQRDSRNNRRSVQKTRGASQRLHEELAVFYQQVTVLVLNPQTRQLDVRVWIQSSDESAVLNNIPFDYISVEKVSITRTVPWDSTQAIRWEMDQRSSWPSKIYLFPLEFPTLARKFPSSLETAVVLDELFPFSLASLPTFQTWQSWVSLTGGAVRSGRHDRQRAAKQTNVSSSGLFIIWQSIPPWVVLLGTPIPIWALWWFWRWDLRWRRRGKRCASLCLRISMLTESPRNCRTTERWWQAWLFDCCRRGCPEVNKVCRITRRLLRKRGSRYL